MNCRTWLGFIVCFVNECWWKNNSSAFHCNQNICGKICTRHCKYVLIWMTAITGSHLSGWTICCFGWGGKEGLPQSLPYPLALQSLRKDLLFNSWLDRIFSPVCEHSDTLSRDNLPHWERVCLRVLWQSSLSEAHTCTHSHTHQLGPPWCAIPFCAWAFNTLW